MEYNGCLELLHACYWLLLSLCFVPLLFLYRGHAADGLSGQILPVPTTYRKSLSRKLNGL